jgi:hypothetical protein
MQASMTLNRPQFETLNAFKKEIELQLWCHLDNELWLKIMPKKALPWHISDMQVALLKILSC